MLYRTIPLADIPDVEHPDILEVTSQLEQRVGKHSWTTMKLYFNGLCKSKIFKVQECIDTYVAALIVFKYIVPWNTQYKYVLAIVLSAVFCNIMSDNPVIVMNG